MLPQLDKMSVSKRDQIHSGFEDFGLRGVDLVRLVDQRLVRISGSVERESSLVTTNWSESIVMIRWTGLAPREFEFPFPGSLMTS